MSMPRIFRSARRLTLWFTLVLGLAVALAAAPAQARSDDTQVPYWASLRANEVNMRVGPGEDYRINWVYHRLHLPVRVVRIVEGWRLVQDPDGASGWIMVRFLSHERTALVVGKAQADMHLAATADSRLLWKLDWGVVGVLGDCKQGWCHLDVAGRAGFVRQENLWGTGAP